ncbi:helix-turn-helix domain-containing protein [Natronobacterium gregoryi]|uniref:Bacterio-opsin activator HTH domain-containing protein n=2 Tax=Natronobacterium gregoryi TaxID=44930 RepID=L0AH21_NATGS|nr:helix-turn-helix domain-containing protein [Natronobacterium gregoryi]AFZ72467.1 putative DNA binding protein [Natronobacterium gregoryi SP2]ELY74337.1 Bacterio-opsin activator HTH domain-containing protein [Natronobacterium gregoryi SP2]PLK21439.1 transcriptional regulator [Natronobacterium gregoryi SP2]SFI77806.1 Predicted DNA binding protein, contains HTH domain [Natronobacterium gregoryi]
MIEECLAVEFRVQNDDCPLAEATRAIDVDVDAQPPQHRSDGYDLLQFVTPQRDELTHVLEADDRISYLHVSRTDGRYQYRCLSKAPCVVQELIDGGLIVETLRYRNGEATIFGAVVGRDVLKGVMAAAGDAVGVKLERVYPLQTETRESASPRWDLTPAQEACMRTALEMGYFAIPRETTSEAVAAELGISKSAFLERLRRGEQALLRQIFS